MWDTIDDTPGTPPLLSHDMPCVHCGHALHVYLACDHDCACGPHLMPGLAA